jgi:CRP-like cAMP-binding protein
VQSEPSGATEYELLKAIPIFAELSIDDMKDLYRVAQETPFAPGAALVELDVEPPGLMVLVEGKAEVFAGAGPQARKLNELATGDYLGEISLIQGGRTSARVVATTPVRALTISRDHFEHYLYAHESAAMRIFRLFAKNLAERVRALSVAR